MTYLWNAKTCPKVRLTTFIARMWLPQPHQYRLQIGQDRVVWRLCLQPAGPLQGTPPSSSGSPHRSRPQLASFHLHLGDDDPPHNLSIALSVSTGLCSLGEGHTAFSECSRVVPLLKNSVHFNRNILGKMSNEHHFMCHLSNFTNTKTYWRREFLTFHMDNVCHTVCSAIPVFAEPKHMEGRWRQEVEEKV